MFISRCEFFVLVFGNTLYLSWCCVTAPQSWPAIAAVFISEKVVLLYQSSSMQMCIKISVQWRHDITNSRFGRGTGHIIATYSVIRWAENSSPLTSNSCRCFPSLGMCVCVYVYLSLSFSSQLAGVRFSSPLCCSVFRTVTDLFGLDRRKQETTIEGGMKEIEGAKRRRTDGVGIKALPSSVHLYLCPSF